MEILINIDVPDLSAALAFYQRGIGMTLKRLLFDSTVAELTAGSLRVFLLQKEAGSAPAVGTSSLREYRRHWTPIHLDIVVFDVEEAAQRAVAAGARLEGPIQDFTWGRQACLSDPFGHASACSSCEGAATTRSADGTSSQTE